MHKPATRKRRNRGVATPAGIPSQGTGHPINAYIFAARDTAELLEPLIAELDHDLGWGANGDQQDGGGATVITARAALQLEWKPEAMARSLYRVRTGESRSIGTELVDALFMAVDVEVEHLPLPVFPAGRVAADDMIDIHLERTGEKLGVVERVELRRALLSFTRGYMAGVNADITTDSSEWACVVDGHLEHRGRMLEQLGRSNRRTLVAA